MIQPLRTETVHPEDIAIKVNEMIDVLNDLLLVFPKVPEQAKMRREFESGMLHDTKPGEKARND